MTAKERFCNKRCCSNPCRHICEYLRNYLDGLAEGKPKWHDLRKDPNDLPKEKTMYRVIYNNPMINRPAMWYLPSLKSWEYSNLPIIAWCELPKFEE